MILEGPRNTPTTPHTENVIALQSKSASRLPMCTPLPRLTWL